MAASSTDPRKRVENIYDNLQLRIIKQRLDQLQRKNRQRDNHDGSGPSDDAHLQLALIRRPEIYDELVGGDKMHGRQLQRYDGHSRYGEHHSDPMEYRGAPPGGYPPFLTSLPAPVQGFPPQPQPSSKTDVMEMLLLQGAQMHQAVMQQMMLASLPRQSSSLGPPGGQIMNQAAAPPGPPGGEPMLPLSLAVKLFGDRPIPESAGRRFDLSHDNQNEPMVPLSLARELLSNRVPSVHHHHHASARTPQPTPLEPSRESPPLTRLPSVHGRPSDTRRQRAPPEAPRPPVKLPPVNQPSWRKQKRPVEVLPLPIPPTSPGQNETPEPEPNPDPETERDSEPEQESINAEPEGKEDTPEHPPPPVFPGPRPLRRFRHAGYVVWVCCALQRDTKRGREQTDFLFGVTLKEIVQALHKKYLDPEGGVMACVKKLTAQSCPDLASFLKSTNKKEQKAAFNQTMDSVEEIIDSVTAIMPDAGVLGARQRSGVFQLVQNDNLFPVGYLWEIEQDLLNFDGEGRIKEVDEKAAVILVVGLLLCRALAVRFLLAPEKLGLDNIPQPGSKEANNLKLIASLLVIITVDVYNYKLDKSKRVPRPGELEGQLYSMADLEKFLDMKDSSIGKQQKQIRHWATEYVKRLFDLTGRKRSG